MVESKWWRGAGLGVGVALLMVTSGCGIIGVSTPGRDGGACVPAACSATTCGVMPDGCGGAVQCGSCPAGQSCGGSGEANRCGAGTCTPTTCAAEGLDCGVASDGCGSVLNCGTCSAGLRCGGGGVPNVCTSVCAGNSCSGQAPSCNPQTGACQCTATSCPAGMACNGGVCSSGPCVPQGDPQFCADHGKSCEAFSGLDNCGASRTANCGTCLAPQVCGGSGAANECGCKAEADAAFCTRLGKDCQAVTASDNCGVARTADCGACTGALTCGGGGTSNVCGATCAHGCPTGYTCDAHGVCAGGAPSNLVLDVKAYAVSGRATLNGANPASTSTSCTVGAGGTSFGRGKVYLRDAAQGVAFEFPLEGCATTAATFSGTVFPGTYRVTVTGDWVGYDLSNLPNQEFVVNPALVVSGAVSNLVLDVKAYAVSGRATLNGANPASTSTSCTVGTGGTSFGRGKVYLRDAAQGVAIEFPLEGCATTAATFSGTVFPGTYRVTVTGDWVGYDLSNLPNQEFVVNPALVVSGAVSNLVLDVKAYAVSGRATLNGANPASTSTSCTVGTGGTSFGRGKVYLRDAAQGVAIEFPLEGCATTAATFSGTVFPGTYRVTVTGDWVGYDLSDLPNQEYVAVAQLRVP